jgi:hypothetical protein
MCVFKYHAFIFCIRPPRWQSETECNCQLPGAACPLKASWYCMSTASYQVLPVRIHYQVLRVHCQLPGTACHCQLPGNASPSPATWYCLYTPAIMYCLSNVDNIFPTLYILLLLILGIPYSYLAPVFLLYFVTDILSSLSYKLLFPSYLLSSYHVVSFCPLYLSPSVSLFAPLHIILLTPVSQLAPVFLH